MEKYCFVLFGILLVAALLSTPGIREGVRARGRVDDSDRRRREEEKKKKKEEKAAKEAEKKAKENVAKTLEETMNKMKAINEQNKAKEEREQAVREEDRKTRDRVRRATTGLRTSQQRTRDDAAKEDEKKAINKGNQDEWGPFAYINAPKDAKAPKDAPKDAPKGAPKNAPKNAPKDAPKDAKKDAKKDNAQPAKAASNSQGKGPIPAEALETAGRSWLTGAPMDYIGGDIGSLKTEYTLYQCQEDCVRDKNCRGIVTDFALGNGPGTCQLKSNMGDPKPDASKFPFFYSKYQLPAS